MLKSLKKWVKSKIGLKENRIYNHADNLVYIKTAGDSIYIICKSEDQMDTVVKKMTTDHCKLAGYEEWDEEEDKKWILSFAVTSDDYTIQPDIN